MGKITMSRKERKQSYALEKLKNGEISPVYYYLILQDFGEGDLAKRVGIGVRRLRQHYKMRNFAKLSLSTLKKYAEAFDIPVVNFFYLLIAKQESAEKISIEHMETKNPFFVITKIDAGK